MPRDETGAGGLRHALSGEYSGGWFQNLIGVQYLCLRKKREESEASRRKLIVRQSVRARVCATLTLFGQCSIA